MYVQFAFIQFHIKMEKNVKFSSQIVDACNSRHRIKNVIFLQNNRQPNNNNNNQKEKRCTNQNYMKQISNYYGTDLILKCCGKPPSKFGCHMTVAAKALVLIVTLVGE